MAGTNKFKNASGKRYLRALFYETAEEASAVLYTLKREDHLGYPSLYRLYLEADDPTEYRFATQYLDSFDHWQMLASQSWFKPYVTEWRQELEVRLRSDALRAIRDVAADKSHNSSYQANKYLLDGLWKTAGASKRGRPREDEVKSEIMRLAASKADLDEDAKRIGLN